MQHSVRKLLIDLTLSCEEIQAFTQGKGFEDFLRDRILQLAVEREFEIIGEALVRLERIDQKTLQVRIPNYRKIIGFRNLLAHGYDIIDDDALWDFVINRVPELLSQIKNY